MTDEKKYIDADAAKVGMAVTSLVGRDLDNVMRAIDLVPAADVRPVVRDTPHMEEAIEGVIAERRRQIELWGTNSDNQAFEWMSILGEEFGELCEAVNETFFRRGRHPELGGYEKIIKEATQVAAVAVAIVESASCGADMREKRAEIFR